MGLTIFVGLGAALRAEGDEEAVEQLEGEFEVVNDLLESFGLPPHQEPYELDAQNIVSLDLYGYSGLHQLRRVAAHLALGEELPPPGDAEAAQDPALQDYYRLFDDNMLEGKAGSMRFQHLIIHSDAEGFYLPAEFDEVLVAEPSLEVPGDTVGSSPRLLEECLELARALELPDGLDPESEEVLQAADGGGEGEAGAGWRRYGVESHTCLALIRACRASVETGAAVVFS
ncbi:MAG TPA: hypothetical protein VN228_21595 [Pyrinomonadaceae bacterium]|nr:hypothetical protein [Pyrinomonadaceae bacterium]